MNDDPLPGPQLLHPCYGRLSSSLPPSLRLREEDLNPRKLEN